MHAHRDSPTAIAREGLGLARAIGATLDQPVLCMACGSTIAPGEAALRWAPSPSTFTDWQYLARDGENAPSGVVCGDCAPLLGNDGMTPTQHCVISREDGAWSLSKDVNIMWFLRTPPKPPFVAVIADSMKQHLLWRAAVTTDTDLLYVQIGRSSLAIDRPLLFQGEAWCIRAAELARELGIRVTPRHPFRTLDRKRAGPEHAILNPRIIEASRDNRELADLLDALVQLGEGELWALSVLAKATVIAPLAEPLKLNPPKKRKV